MSLAGGDTEIPFEVIEEHEYGYHEKEFEVWTGKIEVKAGYAGGEVRGLWVVDGQGRRVGEVAVRVKGVAD